MKHFTHYELDAILLQAKTKGGENAERDFLMILLAARHALRASEVVKLKALNVQNGYLVCPRLKRSKRVEHKLLPDERPLVEAYIQGMHPEKRLFDMTRENFWKIMQKYGRMAELPKFLCHPHALKHTTAMLAYEGGIGIKELQEIMGHKNGANTLIYTEVTSKQADEAYAKALGFGSNGEQAAQNVIFSVMEGK